MPPRASTGADHFQPVPTIEHDLEIIPILNKIDMDSAMIDEASGADHRPYWLAT